MPEKDCRMVVSNYKPLKDGTNDYNSKTLYDSQKTRKKCTELNEEIE